MSLRTRALIFSTFFGNCLAIGLLLVSLTTNYWVYAYLRRSTFSESYGIVNYGLFYGNKDLNSGVGVRSHPVVMLNFMQEEPHVLNFWLWLLTTLGTGFGLLSCAVAAIAAVLKAASSAKNHGVMMILLVSSISAAASQACAFFSWLVQFYQNLIHNVLAVEDVKLHWYSRGLAYLGFSFYLLLASILVVLLNIITIIYAKRCEKIALKPLETSNEEKNREIIMLY